MYVVGFIFLFNNKIYILKFISKNNSFIIQQNKNVQYILAKTIVLDTRPITLHYCKLKYTI